MRHQRVIGGPAGKIVTAGYSIPSYYRKECGRYVHNEYNANTLYTISTSKNIFQV